MRRHADAVLAAALLAAAAAELVARDEPSLALQLATSAVLAGSLLLRARRLEVALALQCAAFAALGAAGQEPAAVASIPPVLICLFSTGAEWPLRRALAGLAAVAAAVFASSLVDEGLGDAVYVTTVFVAPPWVAGRLMGARRAQVEALERLSAQLAEERARAEALAAEAERGRIAREMHDVLSHGLGVMVLQAGAGPRLLSADPEAARAAFRSIRETGERARRELGAALADRGRAGDLRALVAAVPGARLDLRGDLGTAAPGVRLAVERILQEALTNAIKHGGGDVAVQVACDDGAVELTVRDAGERAGGGGGGTGRGLIGMRERAAAYGGTLDAGPHEGGFEVRARLPAHPR